MLVLAIDSATPVAGVALVSDRAVIREEFVNFKKNHSEILLPLIHTVLKESECTWHDLTALAVSQGPGSFTGLRIGMATVKGLSLATGLPIVGIPTLDVLASNVAGTEALVTVLLDARKHEVYCCHYDVRNADPRAFSEMTACSPEAAAHQAIALANQYGREKIILLGDGFYPYRDFFQSCLGDRLLEVPSHIMLPRAAALGYLACQKAASGQMENAHSILPIYIRLSEAEYRLGKGAVSC